jgi:hypothetical protein
MINILNIFDKVLLMTDQNYILLIMNCKKYQKKATFQKKTWLKLLPTYIKYYHVIGDENLNELFKFDNENQILWVKTPDDYNSLPKKVIASYKAIYETFNFKYIFKTDDDQILVNNNFFKILINILSTSPKKIHYGGYIIDIKQNQLSQYHRIHPELPENLPILKTKYCTGRFYFLSKDAIIYLLGNLENINKEYFEDYAIGYNLSFILKSNMLHLVTNNYFTDIELSDFPKLLAEGKI